jgi:hypothetical protein
MRGRSQTLARHGASQRIAVGDRADVFQAIAWLCAVDQQLQVGLVIRLLTGPTGGQNPRRTTERLDANAGVIGNGRAAADGGAGAGLDQRMGSKAVAVLSRRLATLRQRNELVSGQQPRELNKFVLVMGGDR